MIEVVEVLYVLEYAKTPLHFLVLFTHRLVAKKKKKLS